MANRPEPSSPSPVRQPAAPTPPSAFGAPAVALAAASAAPFKAPAKGAVLLHIHTDADIASYIVENAQVQKLRSQFGKGPGFEKWLLQKLRYLLVSA